MNPETKRAAIYIGPGDGALRLAAVKQARSLGAQVVATFESGMPGQVPLARDQIVVRAHSGLEILIISRLAALGSNPIEALGVVGQLAQLAVAVMSLSEPWLTDAAQSVAHVHEWLIHEQSLSRSKAIKDSLRKAREQGRRVGRPPVACNLDLDRATELLRSMPLTRVAAAMSCGASTLRRALREHEARQAEARRVAA